MGYKIQGREYSDEQIIEVGKRGIRKRRIGLRIPGFILLGVSLLFFLMAFTSKDPNTLLIDSVFGVIIIIGAALFITFSFVFRADPLQYGMRILQNSQYVPIVSADSAFDLLESERNLVLSKKPLYVMLVNGETRQFQIQFGKQFSKIYNITDLIEYEINVDNETVISSKTKSKKGVGKALAGGLLFGGAGLVAGAVAGNGKSRTSTTQKEIHHYSLVLRVNDIAKPSYVIELMSQQVAEDVNTILMILTK